MTWDRVRPECLKSPVIVSSPGKMNKGRNLKKVSRYNSLLARDSGVQGVSDSRLLPAGSRVIVRSARQRSHDVAHGKFERVIFALFTRPLSFYVT